MLPLLDIKNLSISFKSGPDILPAVKNVSLSLQKGETLAIVGESGSGKSVTALSILKLLPAKAIIQSEEMNFSDIDGEMIDLKNIPGKELGKLRGGSIAMIFQEPMTSLNPVFTCGFQVSESIRLHKKISSKAAKQKTIEWFKKVKLPEPEQVYKKYPHQLSGGQKQRVMIAMAMCCDPSLLICDEPTTALDVTVQKAILGLLKNLQQQQKMGIIFITHDLGVVKEFADKVIVMYKGEVAEQGSVQEIFTHPKHPYTKGLLACRPVLHNKGERLPIVSDFLNAPLKNNSLMNPEPIQKHSSKNESPQEILLSVKNLTVKFTMKKSLFGKPLHETIAVDHVSFDVYKGETLGLVGESGCGKTTLGRSLLRLIDPTEGEIIFNKMDLVKLKKENLKPIRRIVQLVFQDPYSSLNPRITIGNAISETLKIHNILPGKRPRKEKVIDLLEKVGMQADHFNRYPHEFSGGQRQRIVIARALSLNPDFLVCDEPVSALDVSVQAQVLNLLNDIKKEFGFTVIFISHDLSVVKYISDRIMVMHQGKILETGNADDIYTNPKTEYTKQLLQAIPGKV